MGKREHTKLVVICFQIVFFDRLPTDAGFDLFLQRRCDLLSVPIAIGSVL